MFDIGASELLLTVIVAIVVIGPKDLPRALRMAGGWIGKIRRISGHFRSGIEEMIRQAEVEEMEKKWLEKNAAIMQQEAAAGPAPELGTGHEPTSDQAPPSAEGALPPPYLADPHGDVHQPVEMPHQTSAHEPAPDLSSPELPLASPKARP